MELRRLDINDTPACVALAADREWTTSADQWIKFFEFATAYGFDHDGELSGSVTIFPYPGMSFVGMMLVRRRLERRGFGRRLLEYALASAGQPSAALFATPFGVPLYEAMGFTQRARLLTYRGQWTAGTSGDVRLRPAADLTPEDRKAIERADTASFGTERTPLLALLLSGSRTVATVAGEDATSYAIARSDGTASDWTQIGPVVAQNDDAALALIGALSAHSQMRECGIHVLDTNPEFARRLEASGLVQRQSLPYMVLGTPPFSTSSGWYGVATKATG